MNETPKTQKKILENPFVGSLVVPIAIVLVGALIIFGVTKMLSSERSYKDLVNELQSKTFGNKWVAAYELSKQINSSQIPQSEYPWLVQNLTEAYKGAVDPRTKGFIVAAMGSLKTELAVPMFQVSITDPDLDVQFHTLVALANANKGINFDWSPVLKILTLSGDEFLSIKQAAILTLATHRVPEAQDVIKGQLSDSNPLIRYSAATALVNYKDEIALPVLTDILNMKYPKDGEIVLPPALDSKQISNLKLGVLMAVKNNNWNKLNNVILDMAQNDPDTSLTLKAKEVLKELKN